MTFKVTSNYDISTINDKNKSILFQWDVDSDGDLDFIGEGDELWWSDNLDDFKSINNIDGKLLEVIVAQNSDTLSIVILRKKNNEHIIEWIEFDSSTENFLSKWRNERNNSSHIQLIKADGNNETIWIIEDNDHLIIDKNGTVTIEINQSDYSYNSSNNLSAILWPDRIEIIDLMAHYGKYESISLIDLENDGFAEIIALDGIGDIYAFDNNFLLKSGFPVKSNAIGPILAMDLLGDNSPELIYQDKLGIIQILDNEGNKIDQIATSSQLKGLGVYEGRHAIITTNDLILFKNDLNGFTNEWNYRYSTVDYSRYLIARSSSKPSFIIDQYQTYAYPNPSYNENVIFRIHIGLAESLKIEIFDIAGYFIESFSVDISSSSNFIKEFHWDVSTIDSGIYIARVVATMSSDSEEKIIKVGVIK
jgi:hypothetical protein